MALRPQKILRISPRLIGLSLFILFLIFVAVLFRQPPQIVDVLTGRVVADYSIHIAPGRVLFEPILGPLLYYLRADQPLSEFTILMLWVLGILFLLQWRRSRQKYHHSLLHAVKSTLLRFPMYLAGALAVLFILVLAPLPCNTIVNQSQREILVNLHSHTHWSHDGLISPENLHKWHRRNGFDAFFLTEHNHHRKTLELVDSQRHGAFPDEPLVMAGQEYSSSNHLLLLGLTRDFRTKDMPEVVAVDSARKQGGVMIVAHWFSKMPRSIQFYIDSGADGFEIVNQGEGLQYDPQVFSDIKEHCERNGLLMVGSCDYHGYGNAAYTWNAFDIPGWRQMKPHQKQESILQVLRNREQDRIRVLIYRDRDLFPRSFATLSPLLNAWGYFRSLNDRQVISWLIWSVLIFYLAGVRSSTFSARWKSRNPLLGWTLTGAMSGLFLFYLGIQSYRQAARLVGFNEILAENAPYLLFLGLVFFVYSVHLAVKKPKN